MASVNQLPELVEKLSLHAPSGGDNSDEIDSLLKTIAALFNSIYGKLQIVIPRPSLADQ